MANNAFGIDLGTNNIKIYNRNDDNIMIEKNMIAIENKNTLFAYGNSAFELYEKAPSNIHISYPLSNGVIADIKNMETLVKYFIGDLQKGNTKPSDFFIAVPTDVTEVEKRAFYDLIKGFETAAQQTSYSVVFCSALGGDVKSKENYVKYLSNGVVDAVILYGSYRSDESMIKYIQDNEQIEFVMIENDVSSLQCNKLLIDNFGGAKNAVNYLKEKKHRKIAHICGNPNKKVTIERFNGYIQAMQESDLEVKEGYIQYSSADYRSGYERMNALLDLEERPTAVFCSDDAIASYAVRAALDRGLRVPEDISIMGFDNQSILPDRYRGPEITTVEQPLYTIGMDSIRLVSERLSNNDAKMPVRKTYETKIIERETVCEYQG